MTKFFTNTDDNTLYNKFNGVFTKNPSITHFDILVGFFYFSGYYKIQKMTQHLKRIRILVGMSLGPNEQKRYNEKSAEAFWRDKFSKDVHECDYKKENEDGLRQFIKDVKDGRLEIKIHPKRNIHAKIYIMLPEENSEHNNSFAITGSSNLSAKGIGVCKDSNYEFNVMMSEYAEVKFSEDEFNKLWDEAVEIDRADVEAEFKKTHFSNYLPRDIYYKALYEYYKELLENDTNDSSEKLPVEYKNLRYQHDAVVMACKILEKHNGVFLSDVVGLGKTVVCTLIIKRIIAEYNLKNNHNQHFLLACPPAIVGMWQETFEKFEISGKIKVTTKGKLKDEISDAAKYAGIIIDESHKFRNRDTDGYKNLQIICKSPFVQGDNSRHKKIILMSATPMNNSPNDILNQILLFKDGEEKLGSKYSIVATLSKIHKEQERFKKLANPSTQKPIIDELYQGVREDILKPLTIRRTRADLMQNSSYKADLDKQKITFPVINKPVSHEYEMNEKTDALFNETLRILGSDDGDFKYTCYRWQDYLTDEALKKHNLNKNFLAPIHHIIKTLLIKRLDSSFHAFKESLQNSINNQQMLLHHMKSRGIATMAKNIEQLANADDDDIRNAIADGGLYFERSDLGEKWNKFNDDLHGDIECLKNLLCKWSSFGDKDPKVDKLKSTLGDMFSKQRNPNQKLIIFTESKSTAGYLQKQLHEYKLSDLPDIRSLCLDSSNLANNKEIAAKNFDQSHKSNLNDYNLLITTNVLAEGINLHKSNIIINYDTPWNSTILMQRIGRVNRIGTHAKKIYIYNFMPMDPVNAAIRNKDIAMTKLEAFHRAFGEDSQIYTDEERHQSFKFFESVIGEDTNIDENIEFMEDIRSIMRSDPKYYEKIKRVIPLKARCIIKNKNLKNSTISFIKTINDNSDNAGSLFTLTREKSSPDPITNIEAFKILKENSDKPSATSSIPSFHYKHVGESIDMQEDNEKSLMIDPIKLKKAERQAIDILNSFKKSSARPEFILFEAAVKAIKRRTYIALHKDINKIIGEDIINKYYENHISHGKIKNLLIDGYGLYQNRAAAQSPRIR